MFEVRFWGVRGSIASAGAATASFGGNTSCVEVRTDQQSLILDAGTGLRGLGGDLLVRAGEQPVRARILLSHLHWDHIQGFPFFAPAWRPGDQLELYGPARDDEALRAAMDALMRPPHFPVGLGDLRASLTFHGVRAGAELELGDLHARAARAVHPNGCLAWRVSDAQGCLVYATDTEHRGDAVDPELCALAAGAELLIYDAQYTPAEYAAGKKGWGHSTWEAAVKLARAAGVRRLVLFHHDPARDDEGVRRIEAEARRVFPETLAAREGEVLVLGGGARVAA